MKPAHWPEPPRPDAHGTAPTPQQLARWHERVEELCAGAIRALAGEPDLHYRGRRLHRGRQPLPLFGPYLVPALEQGDDADSFRGAADGVALRLQHSDADLHRRLCPGAPVERLVFELLEQLRCESLVDPAMPGVRRNLRLRFDAWSRAFHRARLLDTARGLLLYTLAQTCRARVTGEPVLEDTEDLMESTRAYLAQRIGHDLAGLRRQRHDQGAYAAHALAIARTVAEPLEQGEQTQEQDAAEAAEAPHAGGFRLLMDFEPEGDAAGTATLAGDGRLFDTHATRYAVFTRAYDREVAASALVRPEPLRALRERLDARIAAQGVQLPPLVRQLQALLARPQHDGWHDGQQEGLLDGRRLAQLIAQPTERRLFRAERWQPLADASVTLLLDCSASMKAHAEWCAMLADVLARALERLGARCELLGFTTGAWNGGRAQRDWQRAGRPAQPGRLNELCHIVFKDAATPWTRGRAGIAALLRPDLFRESVDGEALQWAAQRLAAQEAERRWLVVVSDGCPMDGATRLANEAPLLDLHLQQVAQRIEQQGQIALLGVGVGLDLSPYYARSHVLDLAHAGAGMGVFREVVGLLARASPSHSPSPAGPGRRRVLQ